MASRTRFTSISTPPVSGPVLVDNYDGHLGTVYNYLPLAFSLTGTPTDAIVATLDPPLDGSGLQAGMCFWFTANATNTGAMTVAIDGLSAVNLVDFDGSALSAGDVENGSTYLVFYDGTNCRIVSKLGGGTTQFNQYDVFTASGTLTKPSGFPDDGLVVIDAWGAGGSGRRGGIGTSNTWGGLGGAFTRIVLRGIDLGTTETVTIGAGGASVTTSSTNGNAGTDTTLGSLLTAKAGPGGTNVQPTDYDAARGLEKGGYGYLPSATMPGRSIAGGAGGHAGTSAGSTGEVSDHGGDGGDGGASGVNASAGQAPGGGGGASYNGGNSGAGARGEMRVRWIA